jgi:hypothetical protein
MPKDKAVLAYIYIVSTIQPFDINDNVSYYKHDDDVYFIKLHHVGYKDPYPYGPAKTA